MPLFDSDLKEEAIPDASSIYRNISNSMWRKDKRTPAASHFSCKNDGMSVDWGDHCGKEDVFVLIGLQKNQRGEYKNPRDYKAVEFNVGEVRAIKISELLRVEEVKHNPLRNNHSHSLVCFPDDEKIRLKFVEMTFNDYEKVVFDANFDEVERRIREIIETREENDSSAKEIESNPSENS